MTKALHPTAVAMHASAEFVLRFERGFHNFPAVKTLIPEARCCAPWYSFDGDRHLEIAIPNETAYRLGFDGTIGRFSVLLPAPAVEDSRIDGYNVEFLGAKPARAGEDY